MRPLALVAAAALALTVLTPSAAAVCHGPTGPCGTVVDAVEHGLSLALVVAGAAIALVLAVRRR